MKIFLDNKIIKSETLSPKAIAAYVGLRKLYKQKNPIMFLHLRSLTHAMTGELYCERRFMDDLSLGVDELINNQIIKENRQVSKVEREFDLSSLYFDVKKNNFTVAEDDEVYKIMKYKANKFNLLRYYLFKVGSLMYKDAPSMTGDVVWLKDLGYWSQTLFKEQCNISRTTIVKYNRLLDEAKIIYEYRPLEYKKIESGMISFSGVYGRYRDKDKVIASGIDLENAFINGEKLKNSSTFNRSMATKFAWIQCASKEYDYATMKEVYLAMIERNKELRKKYYTDELYEKYKKDLSVFEKYDFYEREEVKEIEEANEERELD